MGKKSIRSLIEYKARFAGFPFLAAAYEDCRFGGHNAV
jgi:hypothetical protein